MHPDPHALKIYVDGSALKNPGGPGGAAGIAEFPDRMSRENEVIFQEGYLETTNNRMELRACLHALDYIRRIANSLGVQRVIIITDSLYISESHRRAPYWKKEKWKNLDGRPLENADLWNEFLLSRSKVRVSMDIQLTKGKSSPVLKEVDRIAKAAARQPTEVDRGFRGGKVARSKTAGKAASTLFPASGQEATVNIYRKKYAGKTEDKVFFDLFSDVLSEFTAKHHAYTTAEIAYELHRSHCYRVRFNSDPKHPFIDSILAEIDLSRSPSEDLGDSTR
jgi:ribonuclease HI